MIVINSIETKFKTTTFILKSIAFTYAMSFFYCSFLSFKLKYEILPNSLCLPFIDPTYSFIMIKVYNMDCCSNVNNNINNHCDNAYSSC